MPNLDDITRQSVMVSTLAMVWDERWYDTPKRDGVTRRPLVCKVEWIQFLDTDNTNVSSQKNPCKKPEPIIQKEKVITYLIIKHKIFKPEIA